MSDSTPTTAADQTVPITRIVDAPRQRVFRAWINPDDLAAWSGPQHMDAPGNISTSTRASAGAGS